MPTWTEQLLRPRAATLSSRALCACCATGVVCRNSESRAACSICVQALLADAACINYATRVSDKRVILQRGAWQMAGEACVHMCSALAVPLTCNCKMRKTAGRQGKHAFQN